MGAFTAVYVFLFLLLSVVRASSVRLLMIIVYIDGTTTHLYGIKNVTTFFPLSVFSTLTVSLTGNGCGYETTLRGSRDPYGLTARNTVNTRGINIVRVT
jgi:hypothetical protein